MKPQDHNKGMRVMTGENPLDLHIHLHSIEIISDRWLQHRCEIHPKKFMKFVCGIVLGISIIGVLLLQWWR